MMNLGVVIVNWRDAHNTIACAQSLEAWNTHWALAVFVVDNNSGPEEVAVIRAACPAITTLANETNLGFGGATNIGISAALAQGCEVVLLLNNDARITQESMEALIGATQGSSQTDIVGPLLMTGDRLLAAGGKDISRHVRTHQRAMPPNPEPILPTIYVPGTVVLIRREVFDRIGLLDEDYFFSGEVADFCERARLAGFRIAVETRSYASHDLGRSGHLRHTLYEYYTLRNRFLFIRKFRRNARLFYEVVWLGVGLVKCARAVIMGRVGSVRIYVLACLDGLRGRFGGQNARIAPDVQ